MAYHNMRMVYSPHHEQDCATLEHSHSFDYIGGYIMGKYSRD